MKISDQNDSPGPLLTDGVVDAVRSHVREANIVESHNSVQQVPVRYLQHAGSIK